MPGEAARVWDVPEEAGDWHWESQRCLPGFPASFGLKVM